MATLVLGHSVYGYTLRKWSHQSAQTANSEQCISKLWVSHKETLLSIQSSEHIMHEIYLNYFWYFLVKNVLCHPLSDTSQLIIGLLLTFTVQCLCRRELSQKATSFSAYSVCASNRNGPPLNVIRFFFFFLLLKFV